MVTELLIPAAIAVVAVMVAWKLLKGLVKTVMLVGIVLMAGFYYYGGGVA